MFDPMFLPPRHNAALHWLAQAAVPLVGRVWGNLRGLTVSTEDLDRLTSQKGRAILCPNHPTETDPVVVFWLSRLAGQKFEFLATREVLEGVRGKLLNQLGVYSVIRGFPDRESIRTTRRLLAEEDRKVVIFPEGFVYEHNDLLMEFQSGVVQMGFWALDDLEKSGRGGSLPILPIAIKYQCRGDASPWVRGSLDALEAALKLAPVPKEDDYRRLCRVGSQVLAVMERQEGLKPDDSAELAVRIEVVRSRTLLRVSRAIGVELDERAGRADQIHQMANELRSWVGLPSEAGSEYEERLYHQRTSVAAPLFGELLRLHNFIALTGDYVAQEPTPERFLEVLGRLQVEVLGKVRHRAPLVARVGFGDRIPLEEHLSAYRGNKRQVVAEVTRELHGRIAGLLRRLSEQQAISETPADGAAQKGS